MTDEYHAERGRMAQAVLDNPVYAEAYAEIEREFITRWRASRDPAEREDIHRALLMLEKARDIMAATMRSGTVAVANLTRKQNLLERAADRVMGRRVA